MLSFLFRSSFTLRKKQSKAKISLLLTFQDKSRKFIFWSATSVDVYSIFHTIHLKIKKLFWASVCLQLLLLIMENLCVRNKQNNANMRENETSGECLFTSYCCSYFSGIFSKAFSWIIWSTWTLKWEIIQS